MISEWQPIKRKRLSLNFFIRFIIKGFEDNFEAFYSFNPVCDNAQVDLDCCYEFKKPTLSPRNRWAQAVF